MRISRCCGVGASGAHHHLWNKPSCVDFHRKLSAELRIQGSSVVRNVQSRNPYLKNSTHQPSLVSVLLIVCHFVTTTALVPTHLTDPCEMELRARMHHSFLDKRVAQACPHLLDGRGVVELMRGHLSGISDCKRIRDKFERNLDGLPL